MAEHFLTKTQIDLAQCLELGNDLAIECYPALHAALKGNGSDEAVALFAEPLLSRGNDQVPPSVSWYTDVKGTSTPFGRLDEASQSALSAELTRRLTPLQSALGKSETGSILGSALYITDLNDVWSVDGAPVIINWGMVPQDIGRDPAARQVHYGQTLGRFLPLSTTPPLSADEVQAFGNQTDAGGQEENHVSPPVAPAMAVAGVAPAMPSTANDPVLPPPLAAVQPQRIPLWAWLPLLLLILIAGIVLIWLLIPGNRIFPDRANDRAATDEAALATVVNVNKSLEQRLALLQSALDDAFCYEDGTLLMPDGLTIEGLLPPHLDDRTDIPGAVRPADRPSILPPNPERVHVPGTESVKDTKTLLAHIEERTAMVLVHSSAGLSTGTGFFVGSDLLVTNSHVITSPGATVTVYVINNALGSLHEAQILKTIDPFEVTGEDFALLRVSGVQQPSFSVLDSQDSLRLQSVIAAGYPGDLMQSDSSFRKLRSGDRTAVPELAVTDGTVSAEQMLSPQSKVIVHSAAISKGNSGGPLVDMCGRLVGVNTYVKIGPMRSLNFALSASDLIRFLMGTDALPSVLTHACNPQIQRPLSPQTAQIANPDDTLSSPPSLKPKSE